MSTEPKKRWGIFYIIPLGQWKTIVWGEYVVKVELSSARAGRLLLLGPLFSIPNSRSRYCTCDLRHRRFPGGKMSYDFLGQVNHSRLTVIDFPGWAYGYW
jgi:hypothetical protein